MHFVGDKLLLYSLPELQCCCHPSQMVICVFNSRVDLSPPPFSSSSYTNKQEDRSRHAEGARLRWSLWHNSRQLLSDVCLEDLIGCAGLCETEESLGSVMYGRSMTKPVTVIDRERGRSLAEAHRGIGLNEHDLSFRWFWRKILWTVVLFPPLSSV